MPFDTRALPTSGFTFQLPISFQETQTIYIRFESEGSLAFPLTVWSVDSFVQYQLRQQVLNSFLYGVFSILALYHLVIFFRIRDISYLYYALFLGMIVLALMALDGFAAQYLWPEQGQFNAMAARLFIVVSTILAFLFADLATYHFQK